jgi:pseudaminic acid biosynthesis-associated methylase
MNEQQKFWSTTYATEYMEKNATFNSDLGSECWRTMLSKAAKVTTVLECGCNIGRNIGFLKSTNPESKISVIEISEPAFSYVTSAFELDKSFNGPIVDATFGTTFDLVFSMGVLIHIHPDDLLANMQKMYESSSRYILIGEYFSRTPQMIEYQGQSDKLFKRDFGKLFMENFNVQLVDYGFLWGHLYDSAGFDDITWWLFEK